MRLIPTRSPTAPGGPVVAAAVAAVAALLLALAGCETVVEVEPPPHEAALVAQSFFSPDSAWAVRVTATAPYTSAEPPRTVEDAVVEILHGGRVVTSPVRADSGTYVATGPGAVPGEVYTLRVAAPGFESVEGTDTLPAPPPVTAIRDTTVAPFDSLSRRRVTEVAITLEDPLGGANHYGLFVVQARWRVDRPAGRATLLPPSLFTFASDDPALGDSDLAFLDLDKIPYREAFFTDDIFDGARYTLRFEVEYDEPRANTDVIVERVLFVVLLSVTEDFYSYWTTATRQAFTNENPFAEPLDVYSNMTNGLGVFAGFRYSLFPLGAKEVNVQGYGLNDLCRLVAGAPPGTVPASRFPLCLAPPTAREP